MNKLDYSKTINEQLDTFSIYENNYKGYQLTIQKQNKEIERLNIIRKQALQTILDDWYGKNTIPIEKVAISSDIRVKLFKILIEGEDKATKGMRKL